MNKIFAVLIGLLTFCSIAAAGDVKSPKMTESEGGRWDKMFEDPIIDGFVCKHNEADYYILKKDVILMYKEDGIFMANKANKYGVACKLSTCKPMEIEH